MSIIIRQKNKKSPPQYPLESAIQKECWSWLASIKIGDGTLQDYSFHCPNGTQIAGGTHRRRAQYMASLKAQGFRPGVSDIVIAYPVEPYHGAYIEIKRDRKAYGGPKGQAKAVSVDQVEWLERMQSVLYWTFVTFGVEEFVEVVRRYMWMEETAPLSDTETAQ